MGVRILRAGETEGAAALAAEPRPVLPRETGGRQGQTVSFGAAKNTR